VFKNSGNLMELRYLICGNFTNRASHILVFESD
jgi:hypothetical protein